ncbi:sterol 3-beta-glucosyltransferase UGT80A2 [Lactuca sativa]|uniref:sterol 3-beta-glucosyltransferase UGT80A2 n=1 Tax=Lactuca sativa TaxID=4236 RepID=UPI000CD97EA4|nr:sterol 3-beta-glucosyltransferase UGT80A2 [Lactuca sativa]
MPSSSPQTALSYQIVDSLIWLRIRDMINDVRKKKLNMRPVTYFSGSQGSETDIPHGYIWSPHLVPKPKDWGPKIYVVGFCFLDLASNYKPPEELVRWLEAGPKPIYIGFGSLLVQEPKKMTQSIVKALEMTGQRGIIKKGWDGIGILTKPKDFVYSLDNIPHDLIFLQCASVLKNADKWLEKPDHPKVESSPFSTVVLVGDHCQLGPSYVLLYPGQGGPDDCKFIPQAPPDGPLRILKSKSCNVDGRKEYEAT